MGQSYRIRTELGINKTINVQLDQEFEQLEILSLTLQQEDVYNRSCADYGVIVGRVTANNGFGLPNARVSIFIPISNIDVSNPIISSIYPYKSPNDTNEDGYRYNLLPYMKSYSAHAATGTLPSRMDVLTETTTIEIYDKYYLLTSKTNESGDYMIMGVPIGFQTVVMDVDLSDIGEFSLTPQDLIRMGLATEGQVAGNRFKTSTDLNSLPQIINSVKQLDISPLWGEPDICDIAINRLDFDLRDDSNVDIQPTAVFMGSIYSTPDKFRVRKKGRPKDNMGNLCSLQSGPGQILVIRQTIQQDDTGKPILEEFKLEQSGNIIDGDGVWLTELPMNLNYIITNEFGERVISNDPTLGIPTKSKYRFKIKWQQPPSLTDVKRPYFLVPNIKEYGWTQTGTDPNLAPDYLDNEKLAGSYYFGLDWTGYTNTQAAINCEDTFYEFEFNRVYTVSGFIDQFKNGFRGRFIGIKEIDSQDCDNINKFPVNEGFRNFDLIYFLFSVLITILQPVGLILLFVGALIQFAENFVYYILCEFSKLKINFYKPFKKYSKYCIRKDRPVRLPMITYPDCEACECDILVPGTTTTSTTTPPDANFLTQVSEPSLYYDLLEQYLASVLGNNAPSGPDIGVVSPGEWENYNYQEQFTLNLVDALATNPVNVPSQFNYKIAVSDTRQILDDLTPGIITGPSVFVDGPWGYSFQSTIPLGIRINIFNTNNKYYENVNRIKVTFAADVNLTYHYDNTLTVLVIPDFIDTLVPGSILSFINPSSSTDSNFLWSQNLTVNAGVAPTNAVNGIMGKLQTDEFVMNVEYANPNDRLNNLSTPYVIPKNENIGDFCFSSVVVEVTGLVDNLGTITYKDCNNLGYTINVTTLGPQTISNIDYCIQLESLGGTAQYTVVSTGDTCQRYSFPSDIEYYQVLTAITISTTVINGVTNFIIPNASESSGFLSELLAKSFVSNRTNYRGADIFGDTNDGYRNSPGVQLRPGDYFENFVNQKVVIIQRGVDPYSPLLTNKYSIGRIFGQDIDDPNWTFTASTRVNIPIQKVPVGSTTTVPKHDNQDNIFFQSKFFTPGVSGSVTPGQQYSGFTTSNVRYYGRFDSDYAGIPGVGSISYTPTLKGIRSSTGNLLYSATIGPDFYDSAEDLSGGDFLFSSNPGTEEVGNALYGQTTVFVGKQSQFNFSLIYPSTTSLSISNPSRNIMRTERLPSSDTFETPLNPLSYPSLLQQNSVFASYVLENNGSESFVQPALSTGASQVTPDIEGQLASVNVLDSLTDCDKMVNLSCYSGNSVNFGIKSGCPESDAVENGCYLFLRQIPGTSVFSQFTQGLKRDIKSFSEWGFRFRFFYGLCRGVLAQSFTNNWVNGSLYMFPLQIDTYYDQENKPLPPDFAKQLAYFDGKTNNFYYRSSPYLSSSQRFIGRPTTSDSRPVNTRNLLFPTTIINLGIKDDFYQEIIFDPSAKAYIMGSLNPTSYSDTSDLVNLFVISRITDEGFLAQLFSFGNNGLNQLFTRDFNGGKRIDGDLAQSMSINSEYGVIPFSPEFYSVYGTPDDPVVILGNLTAPTMGVFFSSTTFDLQNKDFLTPGVINFRPSNEANAITYPYGIKSQYVPFYQWKLQQPSTQSIFGSEKNNWDTTTTNNINSGIFGYNYQSLSRRNLNEPSYFIGSNTQISDIYERGYIFNVNNTGSFSYNAGTYSSKFLVGAPFHFYFGINQGLTALDKFKTKYSISE
jgi:hypothetical protein